MADEIKEESKKEEVLEVTPLPEHNTLSDLRKEFQLLKGTIKLIQTNEIVTFLLVLDFYSDKGLSFEEIISNYNYSVDKEITDELKSMGY